MRAIDADAFCVFLRETSTRQKYERLEIDGKRFTVAGVLEAVCEDLEGKTIHGFDNAPTIELNPTQNKEHWIETDHKDTPFLCSGCQCFSDRRYFYCPWCGADMGVEVKE